MTPCGLGVISQVVDKKKAVVILLTSYLVVFMNEFVVRKMSMRRIWLLVFSLLTLSPSLNMKKYLFLKLFMFRNLQLFRFFVVKCIVR